LLRLISPNKHLPSVASMGRIDNFVVGFFARPNTLADTPVIFRRHDNYSRHR
jgi:hypothetical protein